jgi:hypothetical protein
MVRTAVRTVLLATMKLKPLNPIYEIQYSKFPFVVFYVHYSCYIREQWALVLQSNSLEESCEEI